MIFTQTIYVYYIRTRHEISWFNSISAAKLLIEMVNQCQMILKSIHAVTLYYFVYSMTYHLYYALTYKRFKRDDL